MHKRVFPFSVPFCFFALLFVLPPFNRFQACSIFVSSAYAATREAAGDAGDDVVKNEQGQLCSESTGTGSRDAPARDAGAGAPEDTKHESEEAGKQTGSIVDVLHAGISRGIQGTASWMDSFFGDWRYASELNESYIRVRYNVFLEDDAKLYRKPDLQARIVLPQLRQKTHIVLAGTPRETSEFSAVSTNFPHEQTTGPEERNVSAAVRQTFFETAKQNLSLRVGAKIHDHKPVLVAGPRYRILYDSDSWDIRFTEQALWESTTGWEARSILDIERPLPAGLFFRTSSEVIWEEDVVGYVYAFSFTVGQPLSRNRGLDYEWVNVFHTEPVNELVEVSVRARYRQRLWRDWLFFEIAPQYRFPRDRSFKSVPGILFRLDMLFGDYR